MTEKFKEVQTAYSVLNDAQERKWYDDHRDSILKGGDGTRNEESESFVVDLWPYFSPACCSGPFDSPTGFYAIYCDLFDKLAESEVSRRDVEVVAGEERATCFNNADSSSSEVFSFYNYWTNFATKMSFSWEDKYNPSDVPNRQVRRAIEKENKKFRDIARKKYNDTVRALASYVRKRDPRVMRFELESKDRKIDEERKRIELKLESELKRKEKRELSRIASESNGEEVVRRQQEREGAFLLADFESDDGEDNYNELATGDLEDIKANADYEMLKIDENSPLKPDGYAEDDVCEVCSKTFKNGAQLLQHLASKSHRKKAQETEKKTKRTSSSNPSNKGAVFDKQNCNRKVKPDIACPSTDSDSDTEIIDDGRINLPGATSNNRQRAVIKMKEVSAVSLSDFNDEASVNSRAPNAGDDSDNDDSSRRPKGIKFNPEKKIESILNYATASLRSMNINASDSAAGPAIDVCTSEKHKNKYKKKDKVGYFPKAVIPDATVTLFPEDSLDPVLHGDGVDVAIMPGPQKKKSKKISLRGF